MGKTQSGGPPLRRKQINRSVLARGLRNRNRLSEEQVNGCVLVRGLGRCRTVVTTGATLPTWRCTKQGLDIGIVGSWGSRFFNGFLNERVKMRRKLVTSLIAIDGRFEASDIDSLLHASLVPVAVA